MNSEKTDPKIISERPTLRTIARISGLAQTTVSRALGNAPDISARTKQRVREIAREVGYVPNRAGVRLRTGRTNAVGLVLETDHDVLSMTSRFIAAIAHELDATPFQLVVVPQLPGQDPLEPVKFIVETGAADAIIINQIEPDDARVEFLIKEGFPFATHGRGNRRDEHSFYDFDNEAFGRIAVETLVDTGRNEILLIAPPPDHNYAQEILQGAQTRAREVGAPLTIAEGMTSDSNSDVIRDGIKTALRENPMLSGLISASPTATMVAVQAVEQSGRTLGVDFDIFSKETIDFLGLIQPQILSLREDVGKAGRFLAKAAIHEIATNASEHLQHLESPDSPVRSF